MTDPNDTPETREEARQRGYRNRIIRPTAKAQERYPLDEYPCERCADPKQGLPHLVDNGSEFYWHHQHDSASWRSGCLRFGTSKNCGSEPRPGTATSLYKRAFTRNYSTWPPRTEEEYLQAQKNVEEDGVDDSQLRLR